MHKSKAPVVTIAGKAITIAYHVVPANLGASPKTIEVQLLESSNLVTWDLALILIGENGAQGKITATPGTRKWLRLEVRILRVSETAGYNAAAPLFLLPCFLRDTGSQWR